MLEADKDDANFIVRQRRNLMVASILLVIAETYGLSYPEINILGNKLEFKFPIDVGNILVWAVLYFLLRFYQYFRYLRGDYIKREMNTRGNEIARSKAIIIFNNSKKGQKVKLRNVEAINPVHPWIIKVQYLLKGNQGNQRMDEQIELNKLYISAYSLWKVAWNTPLITEFALPFIFSALSILFHILKTHALI